MTSVVLAMLMLLTTICGSVSAAFASSISNGEGGKKYEIKNPYSTVDWSTFGQYKADFHAHSVESDGSNAPADMIEDHYAKGYDILAMTDHNFVSTTWDRTDRTNTTYLTTERLNEITSGSDRSNRGMTAIPYSDEQSKSDHVNTFFADFNNESGATLEGNIAKCEELGGISHINHPGRYTGGANDITETGEAASNNPDTVKKYVDLFNKYNSCVGMEIINKKDGDSASDRILWDNILKQTMPSRPVWGFSNDDTHNVNNTGYSYNMMLLPENTLNNVRESMEKGTFYSVALVAKRELGTDFVAQGSSPKITNISVDETENSITIEGENYNSIEWIADGKVIATGYSIDLNNYENEISTYIRAQLKGNGGISFTQPFGITVVDNGQGTVDENKLPQQIGMAITPNPQTSMSINWTTIDTTLTSGKVIVWEKGTDESTAITYNANVEKRTVSKSTIPNVTEKNFYSVTVTGLKADTEYNYRCGDTGIMSGVRSFKTAQSNEDTFTFIYYADPQVSGNNAKGWHANQDIAKAMYPDAKFIYIAGDLTNTTNDEGQWEGFFNQPGNEQYNDTFTGGFISEVPLNAAMGNHDGSSAGVGGMTSHYTWGSEVDGMPVTYAFDYGTARFIVINTQYNNLDSVEQAKQGEFVKKEVTEAKAEGKWTIIELHKPPYTGANHLDDSDTIASRKYWSSVFAGIGVDAVLAGHDHVLSRGFVKADGTKADVTEKVSDRVYVAKQPQNAPLYYVANCGSTLKFYAPITNNDWIQPNDPIAPDYGFLDINSSLPVGDPLNPLGPDTNDDLEGTEGYLRLPTFTAVTVSKDSMKLEAWMTGFDRDTNTIVKDTFLYDSLTINRTQVSKGEGETDLYLKRLVLTAGGDTLESDSTTNSSIKLNLTGKSNLETDMAIPATVEYKTDLADVLAISADGTVSVKNKQKEDTTVKVWVEVTDGTKTIVGEKISIKVKASTETPEVPETPEIPGSVTVAAPVKIALDDMEERPDGSLDYDSSDLELTWEDSSKEQLIGLRFADLNIPKGATIHNAYIQFSVDEPKKSFDPFDVKIYAEDVANSAAFENVPYTVSSRVKTSEYVSWKDAPTWTTEHEAGAAQQTSDIAALVQKIVDKDGWNKGNAISFILSGNGNRTAESFEGSGSNSNQIPTLYLTYTVPSQISDDFTIDSTFNLSTLVPNGLLDVQTTVTNNKSSEEAVLVIVALYDESNKMVNMSYISKNIAIGNTENLNSGFKLPSDTTNYKVKVMVWKGSNLVDTTMNPLSNVVVLQ